MKRLMFLGLLLTGCQRMPTYEVLELPPKKDEMILVVHFGLPDLELVNYNEIEGAVVTELRKFNDHELLVIMSSTTATFGGIQSRLYNFYIEHEWKTW